MTEPKTCPICGGPLPDHTTHPKQKYCSKECAYEGIRADKEAAGKKRVDKVLGELLDLNILDALEGRMAAGTDNRVTAKGARTWHRPGVRFIVLAVEDEGGALREFVKSREGQGDPYDYLVVDPETAKAIEEDGE